MGILSPRRRTALRSAESAPPACHRCSRCSATRMFVLGRPLVEPRLVTCLRAVKYRRVAFVQRLGSAAPRARARAHARNPDATAHAGIQHALCCHTFAPLHEDRRRSPRCSNTLVNTHCGARLAAPYPRHGNARPVHGPPTAAAKLPRRTQPKTRRTGTSPPRAGPLPAAPGTAPPP